MRACIRIIIVSLFLSVLPTVVADDPSFTLPDTAAPTAAGTATADAQVDTTTAFTRAAFFEASQAVNEAQHPSFPASRVANTFAAAATFGTGTIGNAQGLALTTLFWTGGEAWTKVAEVQAVLIAADAASGSGLGAVEGIVIATLNVLCSQPLDPTACNDGSLVGAVEYEVERLLGWGDEEAEQVPDNTFPETRDAAVRLVAAVFPLP